MDYYYLEKIINYPILNSYFPYSNYSLNGISNHFNDTNNINNIKNINQINNINDKFQTNIYYTKTNNNSIYNSLNTNYNGSLMIIDNRKNINNQNKPMNYYANQINNYNYNYKINQTNNNNKINQIFNINKKNENLEDINNKKIIRAKSTNNNINFINNLSHSYNYNYNYINKIDTFNTIKNDDNILVGLNNLGSTCFMNAVLQILNNIKHFSDYLCQKNIDNLNYPISFELKKVFMNLRNPLNKTYSPKEFKDIIGKYNPIFFKNEPNDSRRLFQYLLNSIHKELNDNKYRNYTSKYKGKETEWEDKFNYEKESFDYENKSIIIDLFYGIQSTETFCCKCRNTSYEFEHFNILTLPIIIKNNNKIIKINEMLNDYSKKINLTGININFCSFCDCQYDAYSNIAFYEMPEILIIHPGRKKRGIKYNIKIDFSESLTIKSSDNLRNKFITYNLIGIIYHFGLSGYVGHNVAFCKINNIWYNFDDSKVSKIDIKSFSGEGILFLIYQKNNDILLNYQFNIKNLFK